MAAHLVQLPGLCAACPNLEELWVSAAFCEYEGDVPDPDLDPALGEGYSTVGGGGLCFLRKLVLSIEELPTTTLLRLLGWLLSPAATAALEDLTAVSTSFTLDRCLPTMSEAEEKDPLARHGLSVYRRLPHLSLVVQHGDDDYEEPFRVVESGELFRVHLPEQLETLTVLLSDPGLTCPVDRSGRTDVWRLPDGVRTLCTNLSPHSLPALQAASLWRVECTPDVVGYPRLFRDSRLPALTEVRRMSVERLRCEDTWAFRHNRGHQMAGLHGGHFFSWSTPGEWWQVGSPPAPPLAEAWRQLVHLDVGGYMPQPGTATHAFLGALREAGHCAIVVLCDTHWCPVEEGHEALHAWQAERRRTFDDRTPCPCGHPTV